MLQVASRLGWRLLRRAARRRAGVTGRFAGIHRFSVFQGSIRIAGAIAPGGAVQRLALHLPGGEALPIPFTAAAHGATHFDALLATAATGAEAAHAVLVASLEGGGEWRQDRLGNANDDPVHALTARFVAALREQPTGRMLEIGSRARSGITRHDWIPPGWSYTGFDLLDGPNVDTVGDAHALSQHYPPASIDAAVAFSVLEHLLMPWKFALELNRVLKPGGTGLFVSHQCWAMHDQPWDFWRFSDTAWTALLNPATGFEIEHACLGEPAFIVAQRCHPINAFAETSTGFLASAVCFRKVAETSLQWPVTLEDVLPTRYPSGETSV